MTTSSLPEGTIRLRDGRRLSYAEYGDPLGKPIFFFHGTPGSRLFHHPDNALTASTGARIITVDRPGFGRSDFKAGRTLLDWPSDVLQLADALNIPRFAVMGYSGGGPYALACASRVPDRISAVGLVSSMAPLDNPDMIRSMHGMGHLFFSMDRHLPPLAKTGCRLICATWRGNPDLYYKSQINGFRNSEEAEELLPKMKPMLTADFAEAVRAGTQGVAWDLHILARPWGFHLHLISADVFLWHGESDTQAPMVMGKRLAGALPHCHATFFPREGHWAIHSHWQEILTALVQFQPALREDLLLPPIAVAAHDGDSGSNVGVLPQYSDAAVVETTADAPQGLQPALEAARPTATESADAATTVLGDPVASVHPEPEVAAEAPKAASRKTARRRAAGPAEKPADVSAEIQALKETAQPEYRKTAARRTAASATQASQKRKPTPEKARTVAPKTAKRPTPASAHAAAGDSGEPKALPSKAKGTAKKSARPRTAVVEPVPSAISRDAEPAPEPPEPALAKVSSRRKSAKEAVLV